MQGLPFVATLTLLAVAIASEAMIEFVSTGGRVDRSVTLLDLSIRPMEAPVA